MPAKRLNLSRIHQEAAVIRRQPHFLALSFLFFFPITFSFLSVPSPDTIIKTPNGEFAHLFFVAVFIAAGQATITYSTHRHIYGKPLSLFSTLKTLVHSFLPVFLNTILTDLLNRPIIFFILGFCLLTGCLPIKYWSLLLVTDFQSNCRLGAPIIVLEPNQGIFRSSSRSQNLLTKEMLYVSGRNPYVLDILSANIVMYAYFLLVGLCQRFQSPFISMGVSTYLCPLISFWWAMQLCYYVVSNTLLYVHCKVLRGEDQPEMTASGILEFFQADVGVVLHQNFRNLAD